MIRTGSSPGIGKAGRSGFAGKFVTYVVLVLYALFLMFPFLIVLITAVSKEEFLLRNLGFHVPGLSDVTFSNFLQALTNDMASVVVGGRQYNALLLGFINTLLQVVPTTLAGLFFSGLAAYAYAKMRFFGKTVMYAVQTAIIAFPFATLTMPSYIFYYNIGWTGSVLPIVVPGMFGNAVMIFYLTQFFRGIPDGVVEAARVDGLNSFLIYIRVIIPLAVPAFVAQGVLAFVGGYNNFMGPLLYITDEKFYPLQLVLYNVIGGYDEFRFAGVICASAILAILPLIILYICMRKQFRAGIMSGAVKG